jgi:hypothetical protein
MHRVAAPSSGGLDALLDERIAAMVQQHAGALARPEYVTQRSVERVLAMPPRDYLRHVRAGDWPSWVDRRLRYSKTSDVVAWIEAHPGARESADVDSEARALASVGLRRVAS